MVGGPDYLARLNAPTPWSQRIMPLLKNFVRGGGTVVASSGIGQGGFLAALPFEAANSIRPRWRASLRRSIASPRCACCRPTRRRRQFKRARRACANDGSFGGLVLIEALDEPAARNAVAQLKKTAPAFDTEATAALPLYAMFFGLHKRLLGA